MANGVFRIGDTISVTGSDIVDGTITNADIDASAAIAQSKVALDITDAEINANANISASKIDIGDPVVMSIALG